MPSTTRSKQKPARPAVKRVARKPARPAAARRAPIGVDPPRDVEQALRDDPKAAKAFRAMPPSHRKAYVEFIEEAKRPETRVRRVQQALRMMAQWGTEHPRVKPRSARKR